jgi:hypothetical protein
LQSLGSIATKDLIKFAGWKTTDQYTPSRAPYTETVRGRIASRRCVDPWGVRVLASVRVWRESPATWGGWGELDVGMAGDPFGFAGIFLRGTESEVKGSEVDRFSGLQGGFRG